MKYAQSSNYVVYKHRRL